ncbi:hypothetical protein LOD99_15310 [Oopsacas minuta]|uniref:Uncharacterized protein n=1 Tax=Oopsacas minuta TaxID=111878 RepID=A0AAV7KCU2_9METZ|nr:hypothetical protein LOD99_15310 [Oopsacas minuta]
MTTGVVNQDQHSFDILHAVISSTLQKFYSNTINWEYDDILLDIYREFEDNIDNIPESIFKLHGGLNTEKFTVFRDFARLGLILYQSSFLDFSYNYDKDWGSKFASIPSEIYLLTTISFHLSKLSQTIQSLDYFQMIISQLKFEMLLVAFLLKHPSSINMAFLAYRDENCSETDQIFRLQIQEILSIKQGELHLHLRKMLRYFKSKRVLLLSRLINDFRALNEKILYEAIQTFFSLETNSWTLSHKFYDFCVNAAIDPLSNEDMSTHPKVVIDSLNGFLNNNSEGDFDRETLINNFPFSKVPCSDIPIEEANRVISKYVGLDELSESFSPEDDQGNSFRGLIDFLISLIESSDDVISFLRLMCARMHPAIDFLDYLNQSTAFPKCT